MKHIISILLECPNCSHVLKVSAMKSYKDYSCARCDNSGIFLEPIELIQNISVPYEDYRNGKMVEYIPNHPPFYYETIGESCEDDCNKCVGCEYLDEDDGCDLSECISNHCESCDYNLVALKKLQENHFSHQELFSLDASVATFIIPRLKNWLEIGLNGHPMDTTEEEWKEILGKILKGMELIVSNEIQTDEEEKLMNEACILLGKWFRSLWD